MKKKLHIHLLLLSLILMFVMIPTYQVSASTNGWKLNGQNKYYYVNNKEITGSKKIGKYYYYFDKTGRMIKNKIIKIKNASYYYRPNGKRSAVKNNQMQIGTKYYYFNSKSQVSFYEGFVTIDKKKYFFDSSGKSVSGWVICPVGLAGNFNENVNGMYAANSYVPFKDLSKNEDIRKDLTLITVPKIVKLDFSQEYLLNKLSEQGVAINYI